MNYTFIIYAIVVILILVAIALWFLWGKKAEIDQRRNAQEWPKTTGVVSDSFVEERRPWFQVSYVNPIRYFKPVIKYTYQVLGKSYESSGYQNGYITRYTDWETIYPKKAGKIVDEHPRGKSVTVLYNPENPGQGYLALSSSILHPLFCLVIGWIVLALACYMLIASSYSVYLDVTTQEKVSQIPAVIPGKTEEIKGVLGQEWGMTCEKDRFTGSQTIYVRWNCESPSKESTAFVSLYSRERLPEVVDYISAITVEKEQENELLVFAEIAALTVPSVDPQQVKDWMMETGPTLIEKGSQSEIVVNGIKFNLSNPWDMGLRLEIGELK